MEKKLAKMLVDFIHRREGRSEKFQEMPSSPPAL